MEFSFQICDTNLSKSVVYIPRMHVYLTHFPKYTTQCNALASIFATLITLNQITFMSKTILSLITMITTIAPFASAQMALNSRGQMELGTCDELSSWNVQSNLLDTITTLGFYGSGSMGINGRISFGDHSSLGAMNVFVGEVQGGDTDQLWLHGKKGLYYTSGPHANDTIISYDINKDGVLKFNCDVKSNGFFVASDSRFKENIEPISNALETVNGMTAVTYNLKPSYSLNSTRKAATLPAAVWMCRRVEL